MLVPDYDSTDAAPTSKVQALSFRNSARAQPWLSFVQDSAQEDLNKQKSYFVRKGASPLSSGYQPRLSDVGNMFLCTQGATASGVGELWVEYDVLLMTPQMGQNLDNSSAKVQANTDVSDALIFGSAPVITGELDISIDPATSIVTFNQPCSLLVALSLVGTGLAHTSTTGTAEISTPSFLVNTAGTGATQVLLIRADRGETWIPNFSGSTTVVASTTRFGSYDYDLA
jgi:hypothetical protein